MPELIAPTLRLQDAWREAHEEWGPGAHEDGFGLLPSDDVGSPDGFATWLTRLTHQADLAAQLDPGQVHYTYRWIIERDRVLGGIALRHKLNDYWLRVGGHIGYCIRPSARRRGLGTWALGQMLSEARTLGLDRVLLVCEVDNLASAKTIEHHGGVLEAIRHTDLGTVRRYWIKIG
jgi:predicted acetyltransferase